MRAAVAVWVLAVGACSADVSRLEPLQPPQPTEPGDCDLSEVHFGAGLSIGTGYRGDPEPGPIASQDRVFLSRRFETENDHEIISVDPRTGQETRLTDDDEDDLILGAERETFLQLQRGTPASIVFRTGTFTIELGPADFSPYSFDFDGWRPHQLAYSRAAWTWNDEVIFWERGSPQTLFKGEALSTPTVGEEEVAWLARGPRSTEVHMWGPAGLRQITDDAAQDSAPVWSRGQLFWLSERSVMRYDRTTGEVTKIHDGPCLAPSASDGRAVFACTTTSEYPPLMSHLFLFDGTSTREIPLLRAGGQVFAPRNQGSRVAWLEYDADFDACNYSTSEVGSIAYIDLRTMTAPIEITRVGSGCWCCDSYWPASTLSFEGDVLAWSYGIDPARPEETRGGTGYAWVESPTCPH